MKRTRFIIFTILTLASCARTQDLDLVPETDQDAIAFDVYTRSTVSTKAGFTGDIDEASFKVAGFGVYAYVGTTPDFMRNQHVTYSGGSWVYSPVKYWPNQDTDKIDFFAYAPHIAAAPYTSTADALANANDEDGILYIPGTDATGDPVIVYKTATDPSNGVDLMFGVAAEAHTSPDVTAGLPFLNMTKLKLGEKMKFNFKHALTKLVVNVDGYFDEVNSGSAGMKEVDANTRIVVESVSISTDRLASMGTLNLHNTTANTPKWDLGDTPVTISGYSLPVASNLHYVDGNAASVVHFSQQPLGVTKTAQSLMGYGIDGTTAASLMFVPNGAGTGNLDVTIVYHVITRDSRLETGYNDVRNSITKTITGLTGNAFKPGYLTTLNLHLGLASVKFDADVTNWDNGDTYHVDLPVNEKRYFTYSISATQKAEIAPSNLTFHGDGVHTYAEGYYTWSLMEHPWTTIETTPTEVNPTYTFITFSYNQRYGYTVTGVGSLPIGLFGWATSGLGDWTNKYPWSSNVGTYGYGPNSDLAPEYDWGQHINYVPMGSQETTGSGWRVPTNAEWRYLLGITTNDKRNNQYGFGRIERAPGDYVNGLFLLPDNGSWSDPRPGGKDFEEGFKTNFTTHNSYTVEEWDELADAGVIFLPAANDRREGAIDISGGGYWSSTSHPSNYTQAGHLYFHANTINVDWKERQFGISVRLIREVE